MVMNVRRKAFCAEYIIDHNGSAAARRAGYSERSSYSTAFDLLNDKEVMEEITKLEAERIERLQLSADYVLGGIMRVVERCEQAEPVRDKEGNAVGEYKFEAGAALKGYELLGKHLKLFTEKVEHNGPNGGPLQIERVERVVVDPAGAEKALPEA